MLVKTVILSLFCIALLAVLTPVTAQPANGNFETGDYTGWTVVDGGAWGTGPSNGARTNKEGTYSADSHMAGDETLVGTLRSSTFALPTSGMISFLIAGHNYYPGQNTSPTWDYVAMKKASDGTEIDRVWAPGSDNFSLAILDGSAYAGQNVFIDVVDDGTATGFAWLAVDNFTVFTPNAGAGINGNGNFELGNYTGWTVVEGDAWGTGPVMGGIHAAATGYEGFYLADSFLGATGEASTGILRSSNFTLNDTGLLSFLIAGCAYYPGVNDDPASWWNYVQLKRASDDFVIGKVFAPQSNAFVKKTIDASAYKGVPLYFEVVDDGYMSGYAWIAVDSVEESEPIVPTCWPITAFNTSAAPVIDGVVNVGTEYANAGVVDLRLSTLAIVDPNDPSCLHGGTFLNAGGTVDNDADNSALMYFLWDSSALYVAVVAQDEQLNPSQNNCGEYACSTGAVNGGDAFQLCLDYDQDGATNASITGAKVYIPSWAVTDNSDNVLWFEQFWPVESPNPFTGMTYTMKTNATGYVLETRIPWTAFTAGGDTYTKPFPPVDGQTCGILPMLEDFDNSVPSFLYTAGSGTNIIGDASQYSTLTFSVSASAVDHWTQYEN